MNGGLNENYSSSSNSCCDPFSHCYPPFHFVDAKNVAGVFCEAGGQGNVAKEKIVEWDPEILILDLSTR
jgi:hypothetical protein